MRLTSIVSSLIMTAALVAASTAISFAAGPPIGEWKAVEEALGKSGQQQTGGVFRIALPRTDLKVSVQGIEVQPGFALGSYAAFRKGPHGAMVMGDLVLLDEEVNPVMSGLFANGLSVTALHNHLNEMSPHVMYVHFSGPGDPVELARGLRVALSASGTPFTAAPAAAGKPGPALDQKRIEATLGRAGTLNNGVLQVAVARAERFTEDGAELVPAMGVATAINFQPTGEGRAAITGDFVLVGTEVNPVARALRASGIQVTAIHQHALADRPRLFYMHFWANDDAVALARGLRAALDQTNRAKGRS